MKSIQVLDCTLRDGGHHTQWQFNSQLVQQYLDAIHQAGIRYCEIGYRKSNSVEWKGASDELIRSFFIPNDLNIAVMVDLADYLLSDGSVDTNLIATLFQSAEKSPVNMVRIAAHYKHQNRILDLAKPLKLLGYEIGVNLMRSGNIDYNKIINTVESLAKNGSDFIDILTFADSFGAMTESTTRELIKTVRSLWPNLLGFHGHDNRQEALRNSLVAASEGCDFIDSTISGMGKGPGNTTTEFLLIELQKLGSQSYQANALHTLVRDHFLPLKKKIGWGSDFFFYLAAENGIHPDDVPELTLNKTEIIL